MTATKISALAAASALDGTEMIPVVQGGTTKRASGAQVQSLANTLVTPTVVSANKTLSASDYGVIQYVNTSGIVITFPAAPTSTQVIKVYNGSAANITVNGLTVGAGKDITYISVNSAWARFQPTVDVSSAGALIRTPLTGQWVPSRPFASFGTGTALTANKIFFEPFTLANDLVVAELGVAQATAAGTVGALAIYGDNGSYPHAPSGAPVVQCTTTFSTTGTGFKSTIPTATNVTLSSGQIYWQAICCDGATTFRADTSLTSFGLIGSATAGIPTGIAPQFYVSPTAVYTPGTWPTSPAVSAGSTGNYAIFAMRAG